MTINYEYGYEYGYDKVIRKINKELKELFEQKKKEPERNVKIYVKLSDGTTHIINDTVEFITVEIMEYKND